MPKSKKVTTSATRKSNKNVQPRFSTWLLLLLKGVVIAINVLLAFLLVISGYAGYFEPEEHPLLSVMVLAFPTLALLSLLMPLIWVVWKKWKLAIIAILPIAICAPQVYDVFPLGGLAPKLNAKQAYKFTLLTYNVMSWDDFSASSLDYNPTMSALIKADADIVALQECYSIEPNTDLKITKTQSDSLKRQYPHRVVLSRDLTLLSKFPISATSDISGANFDFAAARYTVVLPTGVPIEIFNVHLKSFGLTPDDKQEYQSMVSKQIMNEDVDSIKGTFKYLFHYVYPKLVDANIVRAAQARIINSIVKKQSGAVILCGDFNDIPGSYTYRKIKGKMHDAYTDSGIGPTISFHANRLYFRIDQVFYKGMLQSLDISRKSWPWSDHYPLLVEFALES